MLMLPKCVSLLIRVMKARITVWNPEISSSSETWTVSEHSSIISFYVIN
jgi:hypothetical protein